MCPLPLVHIEGKPYCDGGIRDSAPLKYVIDEGVNEMVIILTHTEKFEDLTDSTIFNPKNVLHLANRVINIALREMLENDIEIMKKINTTIFEARSDRMQTRLSLIEGKRIIKATVIRPMEHYDFRIDAFTKKDIEDIEDFPISRRG